jgi:phage terminase large subunit-like protein
MATGDMNYGTSRDYEIASSRIDREMRVWDRNQAILSHREVLW